LGERIGNRWKRISEIPAQQFEPRDRCQVKHRANFIIDRIANAMAIARTQTSPGEENQVEETVVNEEEYADETRDASQ
jgi:hypothetical protein